MFRPLYVLALVASTLVSLSSAPSHAWGGYGHQQVNAAAVKLLDTLAPQGSKAFVRCAKVQRDLLVRFAVTPDVDWKMNPNDRLLMWTLQDLDKALAGAAD